MDLTDPEALILRPGEPVTDEHFRKVAATVARKTPLRGGRGVTHAVLPWGTITVYRGGGGSNFAAPFFAPSVESKAGGSFAVSWEKGTIGGVEPVIPADGQDTGGVRISGVDGVVPRFIVNAASFNAAGESLIYFELQLSPGWVIARIVPVAAPAYLPDEPWKARKLALMLRADGTFWRALYSNQGWMAVNRRTNGRAVHFFWSKF